MACFVKEYCSILLNMPKTQENNFKKFRKITLTHSVYFLFSYHDETLSYKNGGFQKELGSSCHY